MNRFVAILPFLTLVACGPMDLPASRSLSQAKVVDGPVVIQRGENYFLHFRREIDKGKSNALYLPVGFKHSGDGGLYYFYGPVSSSYHGQIIERPLSYDKDATSLAQAGRLYWLNPDGSTQKIPLRRERN